jgi:4-amino-4-deoxy-L-arabinose transferase-like glycosyltransferase
MSPEKHGTPASSHRRLADILAAEALAFEGATEQAAGDIPAGRGTRRAAAASTQPAAAELAAEPAAEAAVLAPPVPEPESAFDAFAAPKPSIAEILEASFRVAEPESMPAPEPEVEPRSEPVPESELDSTMVVFPPMPATPRTPDLDPHIAVADVLADAQAAGVPADAYVAPTAELEATTAVAPSTGEPAAPKPALPSAPKPPAPDRGGFDGPPRWQESVPFDDTGVLLRPEALRQRAMLDETELISVVKVDDDGSEAAQAQRPGFWTGAWARRGMVCAILLVQALLSLRNNNTAFEDEALYLYSGHLELGHLLYGTSTGTNFWSYFSGAPVLYPVLGAIADQIGGLFAARLLSLSCMLGTTFLLYLITRRMFGTRAAVCAAALFSCTEPVLFVGNLATYDAPALFLLALAAWIVVRFARSTWPLYLLAIFPAALAVGTKYAALMFVPVIVLLGFFAAAPHFGRWALIRPVALALGFGGVIYAALKIAGNVALQGVEVTTTSRAQGDNTVTQVLRLSGEWGGALFAVSVAGAAFLIALPKEHRLPYLPARRWLRVCLAVLMCGTALMAPLYQAHLHTTVALQKHVGFGLFFAAPLAGYGLVRLVGPHLHRAQLGIGVLVTTFALGMGQSLGLFHGWPNSTALVQQIVKYQKPKANYLVGADEVAIYALRGDPDCEPLQFTNTFFFSYTDAKGQYLTGDAAYTAAIQAGYFQLIAYTGNDSPQTESAIAALLYRATNYKLVATIPEPTSYGMAHYYVWVRK